jgi:hypothetical protein
MTPQDRLVLPTYMRCVVRAEYIDVSNCMTPAPGVAFIGLPARYEKVQTPPHRSRARSLRKEAATIMKSLRGDKNKR